MIDRDTLIYKMLRDAAFHELGIAPITPNAPQDINRALEKLSPEEARRMKRKFRKLWRKAARMGYGILAPVYINMLGLGERYPNRRHKAARKREVLRRVHAEVVDPIQRNIETGNNNE